MPLLSEHELYREYCAVEESIVPFIGTRFKHPMSLEKIVADGENNRFENLASNLNLLHIGVLHRLQKRRSEPNPPEHPSGEYAAWYFNALTKPNLHVTAHVDGICPSAELLLAKSLAEAESGSWSSDRDPILFQSNGRPIGFGKHWGEKTAYITTETIVETSVGPVQLLAGGFFRFRLNEKVKRELKKAHIKGGMQLQTVDINESTAIDIMLARPSNLLFSYPLQFVSAVFAAYKECGDQTLIDQTAQLTNQSIDDRLQQLHAT